MAGAKSSDERDGRDVPEDSPTEYVKANAVSSDGTAKSECETVQHSAFCAHALFYFAGSTERRVTQMGSVS